MATTPTNTREQRQMSMKMSKDCYDHMIAEDIQWLQEMPNTCERTHILALLKESVDVYYPNTRTSKNTILSLAVDAVMEALIDDDNLIRIKAVKAIEQLKDK